MSHLLFFVALVALMAPGVALGLRWFSASSTRSIVVLGAVFGLATAVVSSSALAYLSLSLFPLFWLFVLLVSIVLARGHVHRFRAEGSTVGKLFWLMVFAVAATRLFAVTTHPLPQGWDPSFHLLLAKKLVVNDQMIFSWEPFEDIALHYPLGSHMLLANLHLVSGLSLPQCFSLLLVLVGVLSTAVVFLLAQRAFAEDFVALYSAAAYGFWAVYGSLDYHRWGGLPNALGILFFLTTLCLLYRFFEERESVSTVPIRVCIIVLSAATLYVHHHATLVSGLLLLSLLVFCRAPGFRTKLGSELPWIALGAIVLGLPELLLRFSQIGNVGQTSIFRFWEQPLSLPTIGASLGWLFLVFVLLGVLLLRKVRPFGLSTICVATLLVLFVGCSYVYNAATRYFFNESWVLLTPSRFLTDAVYFLALPAGFALKTLMERLKIKPLFGLLIVIAFSGTNVAVWRKLLTSPIPVARVEAYNWIAENTGSETIVLDDHRWCSYLSWRTCRYTPIPISEPMSDNTMLQRYFRSLRKGVMPHQYAHRPIMKLARSSELKKDAPVLWDSGDGFSVVEVWGGEKN